MSTRSNIAFYDTKAGCVLSIYCHCDGYPKGVGAMLNANYTTESAVRALVALGNLSVLDPKLAPPPGVAHSFDKPLDGVTIAYHRDRGDDWDHEQPKTHSTMALWLADCLSNAFYEHLYLFLDGNWVHVDTKVACDKLGTMLLPTRSP
jgi:hypothetical protein